MRRRDFLLSPAAALLPPAPAASFTTLVLAGSRPLHRLAALWRFGPPLRVLARAHTDWWPSASELPPRWQAWILLSSGGAVLVDCRTPAEPRLPRHPLVDALARALTAPSAAAA
ncbi:MAG: hypothetical protein HY858_04845 [Candidatus Solibacter usitatus]|nr:hypothetical protein [Candidatus Solibacter usitatus]